MRLLFPLSSFLLGLGGLVSAAPNPTGQLSLAAGKTPFTFDYTTPSANAKNWIGIYHTTGGGPDEEKQVLPSLTWKYVTEAKGSIQIDAPAGGGKYKAYFLANDGYKWLANPIEISAPRSGSDSEIKVMTYNLWHGGNQVNNYHAKQVKFIRDSAVDIIGLQEATGDHAKRLGEALGWNWHQADGQNSVGIISRYPITKKHANIGKASGVEVALNSNKAKPFNFWSLHLSAFPYGPWEFCLAKKSASDVTAAENQAGRPAQMKAIIDGTKSQRDSSTPFVLVGDTNAPSHLDWTTSNKRCGVSYEWPTSKTPIDAGLVDSFRKANPDPKAVPGETWSPIIKTNTEDAWNGQPEPQDRIDFIYGSSGLQVLKSEVKVAGTPKPSPNHKDNEWTSDHAVVITTYKMP